MNAKDVKPTRLAAARAAAVDFIHKVPSKFRIGIVSFNGRPFVILPPTRDRQSGERALASITPGNGTALGDAVKLAVDVGRRQRTGDATVPPASILVISDGAQRGGRVQPQAAAELARSQHVPVYTVVLGTENGIIHAKLTGGYVQQIRVPASPDTLRQVAQASGGEFFTAPTDARLQDVYGRLASRLGHKSESREITDLFAGGSAALLLAGGALGAIWLRRVP
jgi:Ca-activated chloride channel family protein